MKLLETLRQWFRRDFLDFPKERIEWLVDQEQVGEFRFETDSFIYTITADTLHGEDYLGCVCKERTPPRWPDLPDGPFDEKTCQCDSCAGEVCSTARRPILFLSLTAASSYSRLIRMLDAKCNHRESRSNTSQICPTQPSAVQLHFHTGCGLLNTSCSIHVT